MLLLSLSSPPCDLNGRPREAAAIFISSQQLTGCDKLKACKIITEYKIASHDSLVTVSGWCLNIMN